MQLPARIGKYELQEFLGGGMSHVYRAQDTVLGRTVAVKILTEQGCTDAETKARFVQEARTAGNFTHDNIIRVFDFGEDQGRPFMIMEFLRGDTLREAIKNGKTGDLRRRLSIALQVARALEYIHSQKIVHRDIKPDNVHLDQAGRVKLMDFGIAKSQNVSLTRAGFTLGTPYYMAPEQVLGQPVNHLVDVYAFGILLYELLAGRKPIVGDSIDKVFQQILNDPLNLDPLRGNSPPAVLSLIERCTAKNSQNRIQTVAQVAAELERILLEEGVPLPGNTGLNAVPTGTNNPIEAYSSRTGTQQPVAQQPPAWQPTQQPPVYQPPSQQAPVYTPTPTYSSPTYSTPAQNTGVQPMSLPGFMLKLPGRFQTQEWFIVIVALGVTLGMTVAVLILRLLVRLLS